MTTTASRGRLGRPPVISREAIVDAAAARHVPWTMAGLASALGVTETALYHYFPSKKALLSAVAERFLAEVVIPPPTDDWQAWLADVGRVFYGVMCRHPVFQDAETAWASYSEDYVRLGEQLISVLVDAGMSVEHAGDTLLLVATVVSQHARLAAAATSLGPLAVEGGERRSPRQVLDAALRMAIAGSAAVLARSADH